MDTCKKAGTVLIAVMGVFTGAILVLFLIETLYDISLIYKNLYIILLIAAILTFVPGILVRTCHSKRFIRVIAWLTAIMILLTVVYFFNIYRLFGLKVFDHQYDEIKFRVEDDVKIVELTESWTWTMENYGGVEYKKSRLRFWIFYDNDLIEHTGEPQP